MTKSGKSVFYFGIYGVLMGVLACLIPGQFISMLKLPELPSGWARILGFLVIIVSTYDIVSGMNNLKPMIKATVYMRLFFFAGIVALVVSGQMPKEILPLGIIDLLGSLWTIFSLKAETRIS
jgi:hypothetical protein